MAAIQNSGVYIIKAVGTDRVKIGWSQDVDARIRSLQTGCPYQIEVINVIATAPEMERRIHGWLSQYRIHGEWFVLPNDIAERLADVTEAEMLSAQIADFLLRKDLSGVFPPSKVDEIRTHMRERFDGIWA